MSESGEGRLFTKKVPATECMRFWRLLRSCSLISYKYKRPTSFATPPLVVLPQGPSLGWAAACGWQPGCAPPAPHPPWHALCRPCATGHRLGCAPHNNIVFRLNVYLAEQSQTSQLSALPPHPNATVQRGHDAFGGAPLQPRHIPMGCGA